MRRRRMVWVYLVLIGLAVVVYTLLYYWGMATIEGEPRSLLRSLIVVVETFTTVGYGEDAPWTTPEMNVLMIAMQFTGVAMLFLALPLFVAPWLESRLEFRVPTQREATDHVVISGITPRTTTLATELDSRDIPYVFVADDRELAEDLRLDGVPVIRNDPESTAGLAAASTEHAVAVVLDSGDERNATIALSVRELAPEVRVVALIEDHDRANYLRYAGVDEVLSPRELLGRSLADKVTSTVTSNLGETVEIGEDIEIAEVPIGRDSPLDGVRLGESKIREQAGVNIIGAWFDGEFAPNPNPSHVLRRSTVLLVAGREPQLETLMKMTHSSRRGHGHERIIIGGLGEVGETVRDIVNASGLETTVVDRAGGSGVDVVGSLENEETLRDAGIGEASGIVLALPEDPPTIFSVLVARELNPNTEIVCRANESENTSKLYRAGADYVLALSSVAGRMLAGAVLEEEVLGLETGIEIVRTEAPGLVGHTLRTADVGSRTGATVIAIERDGSVHTDFDAEFTMQEGDSVIVAGTDECIAKFYETFDAQIGPSEE